MKMRYQKCIFYVMIICVNFCIGSNYPQETKNQYLNAVNDANDQLIAQKFMKVQEEFIAADQYLDGLILKPGETFPVIKHDETTIDFKKSLDDDQVFTVEAEDFGKVKIYDNFEQFAEHSGFLVKKMENNANLLEIIGKDFSAKRLQEELLNIYTLRNDHDKTFLAGDELRLFNHYSDPKYENRAKLLREIIFHHLMYEKCFNRIVTSSEETENHIMSKLHAQEICKKIGMVVDYKADVKEMCEEYSFCKFEDTNIFEDLGYRCVFQETEYNSMEDSIKILKSFKNTKYQEAFRNNVDVGIEVLEMMTVKIPLFRDIQIHIYEAQENKLIKTKKFGSDMRFFKLHLWYHSNQFPYYFHALVPKVPEQLSSGFTVNIFTKIGDVVQVKQKENEEWKHGIIVKIESDRQPPPPESITIGIYHHGSSQLSSWKFIRDTYDYKPGKYITTRETSITAVLQPIDITTGFQPTDVIHNIGPNTELWISKIGEMDNPPRIRGQIGEGPDKGMWVSICIPTVGNTFMQPVDPFAEKYKIQLKDKVQFKKYENDEWYTGNVISVFPMITTAASKSKKKIPLCVFPFVKHIFKETKGNNVLNKQENKPSGNTPPDTKNKNVEYYTFNSLCDNKPAVANKSVNSYKRKRDKTKK